MAKNKVTRKQLLKEPDEFISFTGKAIAFFKKWRKPLTVAAVSFFVFVIGAAAYRYLDNRWENAASAAIQEVADRYGKALQDGGTPAQALDGISASMADLLSRYGGQTAGRMGRLFLADANLAAGRFDAAIDLYKAAEADFGADSFFRYRILESMAQAHMALKQYETAAAALQQVADAAGEGIADAALFQLGLVYEAAGDASRRDAALRSLSEKYPDSQYADLVGTAG